jgi:hypothetical protein
MLAELLSGIEQLMGERKKLFGFLLLPVLNVFLVHC